MPKRTRRLTDLDVAGFEPGDREYSIFDERVNKLALRVQPHGAKSWVVRGNVRGRAVRVTLAPAREMTVSEARKAALAALAAELRPKGPEARTPTFKQFHAIYFSRKVRAWPKESRRSYCVYLYGRIMPAFACTPIGLIRHTDIAHWFYRYSRTAPGGANRALEILRGIFTAAKAWGHLPELHVNPCMGILKNRRPPRGRLINAEGLIRLGAALDRRSSRTPDAVDAIKLLLLTGCRLGEILSLRWRDVQPDRLTLRTSKTGPRVVHLGRPARRILEHRLTQARSVFVFPSPISRNKPRSGLQCTWNIVRQEAQLDSDVRVHDLRHTFASHSVMSGVSLHITGTLLGHRRAETTSRYTHIVDAHLLEAAEQVAAKISNWLEDDKGAEPQSVSRARGSAAAADPLHGLRLPKLHLGSRPRKPPTACPPRSGPLLMRQAPESQSGRVQRH